MNVSHILKNLFEKFLCIFLLIFLVASSFGKSHGPERFTPVGTWEYSVPGVEAGYEKGSMVIEKENREYRITMHLNEYSRSLAENVVYRKKSISFTLVVEGEEIRVQGRFDGDDFEGTITYTAGEFSISAKRAS